ncbi:MAG: hypothetical protein JWL81_1266, partial [Verrucomicrobiales bacterium]|nr:hypothetical protein [Verrucomicrobiales bacterium]
DAGAWPVQADGGGKSLTLIDPLSGKTGQSSDAWRPSTEPGGTPGAVAAALDFAQWRVDFFTPEELLDSGISGPLADPDRDGIVNLVEYAALKNPVRFSANAAVRVAMVAGKIVFTWERRQGAADISDLTAGLELWDGRGLWVPAGTGMGPGISISGEPTGEGSVRISVEVDPAVSSFRFARLRVAL